MKIVIKEREFEYVSDYPTDWKYSAGDPYKFPVNIGGYACFIKRFEKKSPEDISGWNLLQRLKGKNEPNLIRLHDIANVEENGKDIYYVFFEYLDGTTLDKLIPGKTKLNLKRLNDDLFIAFSSLKTNRFWFVDFCEKNIFLDKSGKFSLVDLDSAYPVEETPDKDMYGSKDYWGLVLDFYKKVLNKNDVKLDQLDSTSFNYLQIPFLLLHIIVYYAGKEKDYTATRFFDKLPQLLDGIAPQIKEVFLTALENGRKQPLADSDLQKLNDIIVNQLLTHKPEEVVTPVVDEKPVIGFFKADKQLVTDGDKITFSWQVTQADRLEIYKNKAALKQLPADQTSVELTEFFDSDKKESSYKLAAYSKTDSAQSSPVTIKLKAKKKSKAWLIVMAIILIAISVFYFLSSGGRGDVYVIGDNLVEDSVVTVYVKNLVDTSTVKVFVEGREGKKISLINNELLVRVPSIVDTTAQEHLMVTLSVTDNNGAKLYTLRIGYAKQITVEKPLPSVMYTNMPAYYYGKNLNLAGIKIVFNNIEGEMLSQSFNRLAVKVPPLTDSIPGQPVNIFITNKGVPVYDTQYAIGYKIISLINNAAVATWVGGVLSADSMLVSPDSLPFPGDEKDIRGFAIAKKLKMEDQTAYLVLRTHPKWLNNGIIQGMYPPVISRGNRFFKAKIGFLDDDGESSKLNVDGVTFRVRIHYLINGTNNVVKLYSRHKLFDGKLINIAARIPDVVPNQFSIELAVDAGNNSLVDWAAWVNPRIETKCFLKKPNN